MVSKKLDLNHLYFIKYFSWWLFAWFIFYQFNFTKYNPTIAYYFVILYLIFKLLNFINYKSYFKEKKFYMSTFLIGTFIIFIIDVLPILIIRKREINKESFIFSIILLLIYLIVMKLYYNHSLKEIINTYQQDYKAASEKPKKVLKHMFFNVKN